MGNKRHVPVDATATTASTAAVKIQASVRGFFSRRNFKLYPLSTSTCTEYELKVAGNDPDMAGLPMHMAQDKIMVVGTSGLRVIGIACALGAECPKLFLIDNSRPVIQFWQNLKREIATASSPAGLMAKVKPEICPCDECLPVIDDETGYLATLCNQYGFERIKRMIVNAVVIPQDWKHADTFRVLRNLANYHQYAGVYVYASNIVACSAQSISEAHQILSNIEQLNPDLAIHTDWARRKKPEKVFYYRRDHHQVNAVYSAVTASLSPKKWPEVCEVEFEVKRSVVMLVTLFDPELVPLLLNTDAMKKDTVKADVSDEKPELLQGNTL
ncbi:MAG: hypothetical protein P1U32_00250 [Legionellaceae bacterium]|nr:hypothetical protein [Legionellaceae bacterium]